MQELIARAPKPKRRGAKAKAEQSAEDKAAALVRRHAKVSPAPPSGLHTRVQCCTFAEVLYTGVQSGCLACACSRSVR